MTTTHWMRLACTRTVQSLVQTSQGGAARCDSHTLHEAGVHLHSAVLSADVKLLLTLACMHAPCHTSKQLRSKHPGPCR